MPFPVATISTGGRINTFYVLIKATSLFLLDGLREFHRNQQNN